MDHCKVNKIKIICEKWKSKGLQSEQAMGEINKIIELKESEMPPCTCNKPEQAPSASNECGKRSFTQDKEANSKGVSYCAKPPGIGSCSMPKESGSCSMPKESGSCSMLHDDKMQEKTGSCHCPGPTTVNPFLNFMKEMRETTCFKNKSVVDVAKEASCRWKEMSYCDKVPYIVNAYNVSKSNGSMKRQHSNTSMSGPKSKVKKLN